LAGPSVVVATGLTAALMPAGCASAETTTSATRSATMTSATTSASGSGSTNLMVYSLDSDGPDFSAVLTGAVGDYGPAVTVGPDGKVDPRHTSELELKLAHGSFRLGIADIDKKFVDAASHEPVYPDTCSTYVRVTAEVPIVPGSGTGAYRRISGGFTTTITLDEVHAKPCPATSVAFLRQVITLTGPGIVSLG
jgi:hypothetical protein